MQRRLAAGREGLQRPIRFRGRVADAQSNFAAIGKDFEGALIADHAQRDSALADGTCGATSDFINSLNELTNPSRSI